MSIAATVLYSITNKAVPASVAESRPTESPLPLVPVFVPGASAMKVSAASAEHPSVQIASPVTSHAFSSPADSRQTASPWAHVQEAKTIATAAAIPVKPILAFMPQDFAEAEQVGVTADNQPVYQFKPKKLRGLRKRIEDRRRAYSTKTLQSDTRAPRGAPPRCSVYECLICHQQYGRKYTVTKHIQAVHQVKACSDNIRLISRLNCPYCSISLANKNSLQVHLRNRHGFSYNGSNELVEDLYSTRDWTAGVSEPAVNVDVPMQLTETKLSVPTSVVVEQAPSTQIIRSNTVAPTADPGCSWMYNPLAPFYAPQVTVLKHGHYMVRDTDCQFEVFHNEQGVPSVRTHFYRPISSSISSRPAVVGRAPEPTVPAQATGPTSRIAVPQKNVELAVAKDASTLPTHHTDPAVDGLLLLLTSKRPKPGELTDSD